MNLILTIDTIKKFEGFRPKPYYDGSSKWSVGYGFCRWEFRQVTSSYPVSITQEEADEYLSKLIENIYDQICNIPLNDNQYAALISLIYNIGFTNFENSTLLKLLKQGDLPGAANQFPRWCHSGGHVVQGLVNRRRDEMALFNEPLGK